MEGDAGEDHTGKESENASEDGCKKERYVTRQDCKV